MKPRINADIIKALAAKGMTIEDYLHSSLNIPKRNDWTTKGVTFPEGTQFRTWYIDRPYWGVVKDGALYVKDKRYTSPSAAAVSFIGRPSNGWDLWECRFPGAKVWRKIGDLRKAANH